MTMTDCAVSLAGLPTISDLRNPAPFRDLLPPSLPGHYWAPAVEKFARTHRIRINWVTSNCTPEITVTGPQLRELLLEAYGAEAEFVRAASPYLVQVYKYVVSADDF